MLWMGKSTNCLWSFSIANCLFSRWLAIDFGQGRPVTRFSLVVEVNGHQGWHEKRLDCFRRPCYTHKHLKNSRAPVLPTSLVKMFGIFIFSIHYRCSMMFFSVFIIDVVSARKMLYHAIPNSNATSGFRHLPPSGCIHRTLRRPDDVFGWDVRS